MVAVFDGVVESGVLVLIGDVDVSAVFDEEVDDGDVPVLGGDDEWRSAGVVATVDVSAFSEKGPGSAKVAVLAGFEESSIDAAHGRWWMGLCR